MAYTVFARKYRPQTFEDLVGQEHVTRTLRNAITSDRVAHAFLFTGVRGVGKTTTARLLAKALNCESGPTPEPCGTCAICQDITAGRDTDVQEMDGASNNSVEDVRRLQESIPYRPQRDRFKVVIVDEVHMLSTGAFNAFLKTLEEPPPHVKFIFATTEIHKVPVTIRSRCQRYDFRLIPQGVVSARVRDILASESITADDATVEMVAREAAGSMRDALTLLDQIVAFGGQSLVGEEVARVLGIADREVVHSIAAGVLSGDGARVLADVERIASHGLDMLHFSRQLLDLVRDMVVLAVAGADTELVSLVDEERERARATGSSVDLQELQRAFSGLSKVVEDVAQSGMPRVTLEMGLVRLATRPPLVPLAELVARFDALERRGGGGGGGGGGGARKGGGGSPPRSSGGGGARGSAAAPARAHAIGASDGAPASAAPTQTPVASAPDPDAEAARADAARAEAARAEAARAEAARAEAARAEAARAEAAKAEAARAEAARAEAARAAEVANAPTAQGPTGSSLKSASESPPATAPTASAGDAAELWSKIVDQVVSQKPALGAVLEHGVPVTIDATRLALAFEPGSFFGQQAQMPAGRAGLAEAAEAVLGTRPTIEVLFDAALATGSQTLAEKADLDRKGRIAETKEIALAHPVVRAASAAFGVPTAAMKVRVEAE